jgi:hypothetical protein
MVGSGAAEGPMRSWMVLRPSMTVMLPLWAKPRDVKIRDVEIRIEIASNNRNRIFLLPGMTQ